MGSWYANVTMVGPRQVDIAEELTSLGIRAAVSPTQGEVTIVAPDIVVADQNAAANVARRISERLTCPALALTVADDSVLFRLAGLEPTRCGTLRV